MFTTFFRIIHLTSNNNGLSVIAVDSATGKLAGVFTAENVGTELSKEAKDYFNNNMMKIEPLWPFMYVCEKVESPLKKEFK